jgi:energy-coupling factor transport system permease protein
MARRNPYSTRLLLTCAAIGAAGGLLVVGLNYLSIGVSAVGLFVYGVTIGLWVLPVMIGQSLLRMPGVAMLISIVVALINAPLSPSGFAQIQSVLLFGLAIELPFLLTIYKLRRTWFFWVAHPLSLVAASSTYFIAIDFASLAPWLSYVFWPLAVLSAFAFTALGLLVSSRLRKTGVVRGLGWQPPKPQVPAS